MDRSSAPLRPPRPLPSRGGCRLLLAAALLHIPLPPRETTGCAWRTRDAERAGHPFMQRFWGAWLQSLGWGQRQELRLEGSGGSWPCSACRLAGCAFCLSRCFCWWQHEGCGTILGPCPLFPIPARNRRGGTGQRCGVAVSHPALPFGATAASQWLPAARGWELCRVTPRVPPPCWVPHVRGMGTATRGLSPHMSTDTASCPQRAPKTISGVCPAGCSCRAASPKSTCPRRWQQTHCPTPGGHRRAQGLSSGCSAPRLEL